MMAFPDPLPSSGPLSISTIRNWMTGAGELTTTVPVTLQQMVAASHLTDKTAPYNISDFYGYAVDAPPPYPYPAGPVTPIAAPPYTDCLSTTSTPMNITSNTAVIAVGTMLRGDRQVAGFTEAEDEYRWVTDGTNRYKIIARDAYPSGSIWIYEVLEMTSCLQDYYFQNNNFYDAPARHLHLSIYNVSSMGVASTLVLTYKIQNTAGSQSLNRTVTVAPIGSTNGLADYDLTGTVLDGVPGATITLLSISPASDSTYIYHA